jgi:hypothetical protein
VSITLALVLVAINAIETPCATTPRPLPTQRLRRQSDPAVSSGDPFLML